MHLHSATFLLSSLLVALFAQAYCAALIKRSGCGPLNGGLKCPGEQCCSSSGFCGRGFPYCSVGCQRNYGQCDQAEGGSVSDVGSSPASFYPPADGGAGPLMCLGMQRCPGTLCCSKSGYCGSTEQYCGAGCDPTKGQCWSAATGSNGTNSNGDGGGSTSDIGKFQLCGPLFGSCPTGSCCSASNVCGTDQASCSVSIGCKSEFGTCLPNGGLCGPLNNFQQCAVVGWCCGSDSTCGNSPTSCDPNQGCLQECIGSSSKPTAAATSTFVTTSTVSLSQTKLTLSQELMSTSIETSTLPTTETASTSVSTSSTPNFETTTTSFGASLAPSFETSTFEARTTSSREPSTNRPTISFETAKTTMTVTPISTMFSSFTSVMPASITTMPNATPSSIQSRSGGIPVTLTVTVLPQQETPGVLPGGQCGPDSKCAVGCCSVWGFCGSSDAFCAAPNCLDQCWENPETTTTVLSIPTSVSTPTLTVSTVIPTPPMTGGDMCGSVNGNATCPDGLCCSIWGYCGSSSAHCLPPTCLYQCNGEQNSVRCGPAFNDQECPAGLCCSIYGYCGSTYDYCTAPNCVSSCS